MFWWLQLSKVAECMSNAIMNDADDHQHKPPQQRNHSERNGGYRGEFVLEYGVQSDFLNDLEAGTCAM
jgi:hypothetical protein